jgi:hypothetical protein
VTLSEAGKQIDVKSPIGSLKLATKNTAFWKILNNQGLVEIFPFVAAMVTPKNSAVVQLVTAAAYQSNTLAMGGYQGIGSQTAFGAKLAPNQFSVQSGYYRQGDNITVDVAGAGGICDGCSYYLMDDDNIELWKSGKQATFIIGSEVLGTYSGSHQVELAGRYHHVLFNPIYTGSDRTFSGTRTNGVDEAADDQLSAIYKALQAEGMVYTSVATDYFAGAQNVKTPAESLSTGSANCIDGSLVFASALEAIGMEAHIVITKNHAYVAVGWYPGAGPQNWTFLETTAVGANLSFEEAVILGLQKFIEGDIAAIVSIKAARNAGIVPGGY